jgi:hypothetical protein
MIPLSEEYGYTKDIRPVVKVTDSHKHVFGAVGSNGKQL